MTLKLVRPTSWLSSLVLISPFFLWGTAMVAMKGVLPHTTPFFMAGFRLVPAGILILIAAALYRLPQPKTWKAWLWIGIFALLDGLMFQGFLAAGLERTGAGLGSVMIDSQPIAIALLSSLLFGEVIGIWGGLGLIVGVLGISLLCLPEAWVLNALNGAGIEANLSLQALFNNGQWLMLLASLSTATGTVCIRYVSRHCHPIVATGWHMIVGGLPLVALSAWQETEQWSHLDFSNWMALSYATIFGSAIAYGVFFYIASQGNLTSFTALTFLTPVFALLFGNLLLGEVLSPLQWGGVSLTLVSIYLINQREKIAAFWQRLSTGTLAETETRDSLPELSATACVREPSEPLIVNIPESESRA